MAERIIHNNCAKMKRKPKQTRLLPMDELQHRPCEVDGRPALFHRWVEDDRALLRINAFISPKERTRLIREFSEGGIIPGDCFTDVIRETFALVEYQDGTIAKVKPELIRFTGRPTKP